MVDDSITPSSDVLSSLESSSLSLVGDVGFFVDVGFIGDLVVVASGGYSLLKNSFDICCQMLNPNDV